MGVSDDVEGQQFLNLPLNEAGRSFLQCMLVMEGVDGLNSAGGDGEQQQPKRLSRYSTDESGFWSRVGFVGCIFAVLITPDRYGLACSQDGQHEVLVPTDKERVNISKPHFVATCQV